MTTGTKKERGLQTREMLQQEHSYIRWKTCWKRTVLRDRDQNAVQVARDLDAVLGILGQVERERLRAGLAVDTDQRR